MLWLVAPISPGRLEGVIEVGGTTHDFSSTVEVGLLEYCWTPSQIYSKRFDDQPLFLPRYRALLNGGDLDGGYVFSL